MPDSSRLFIDIITFNTHDNPMRPTEDPLRSYYYTYSTNEDISAEGGQIASKYERSNYKIQAGSI